MLHGVTVTDDEGGAPGYETIDRRLDALARQRFRASFSLRGRERALLHMRGIDVVTRHAREIVTQRVAAAQPVKDGRQTPYRGHPVFVAQHATATCCRTCLERWHRIPKGRALTDAEVDYAVAVIRRWLVRQQEESGAGASR
jgi:hypothetical protein